MYVSMFGFVASLTVMLLSMFAMVMNSYMIDRLNQNYMKYTFSVLFIDLIGKLIIFLPILVLVYAFNMIYTSFGVIPFILMFANTFLYLACLFPIFVNNPNPSNIVLGILSIIFSSISMMYTAVVFTLLFTTV